MDLSNFENPWEHIRLLSDGRRNEAMLAVLRRRAPGARVLEVGCGTGLLSCVAARLGASRVYAVEPTPLVEVARRLVRDNDLQGVVEVIEGRVEDVAPRQVDLAISELLNADPFQEGVLEAMAGARPWLAPGGRMSPSGLRVHVALVRAGDSAREARRALAEVRSMSREHGLDVAALERALSDAGTYKYVVPAVEPVSDAACVWDLAVGVDDTPEDPALVEVTVREPGPVGGAVVWFDATLDDDVVLDNRPADGGGGGHWGHLVCSWGQERGFSAGERVRLRVFEGDDGLEVEIA